VSTKHLKRDGSEFPSSPLEELRPHQLGQDLENWSLARGRFLEWEGKMEVTVQSPLPVRSSKI